MVFVFLSLILFNCPISTVSPCLRSYAGVTFTCDKMCGGASEAHYTSQSAKAGPPDIGRFSAAVLGGGDGPLLMRRALGLPIAGVNVPRGLFDAAGCER